MSKIALSDWVDVQQTTVPELLVQHTTPWDVLAALPEYIAAQVSGQQIDPTATIHPTAIIGDCVQIGANTVIGPYVVIEDNVTIGNNCQLRSSCYIRPYCVIGNNCTLGHATEVKQSLLCHGVVAPHFNYIGDSILGYKAHLGGGVMIANFKSNGSTIIVQMDDERHNTSLRKFGALIGDNCEIGGGAILNPGSCVGRNTVIYPGSIIRGVIPENKIFKSKSVDIEIVERK